jgi:transposase
MRKHYTEAQRAALVAVVARGEASPRVAAARLGVSESTAYYWLKRSRRESVALVVAKRPRPIAAPAFARLVPATKEGAAIAVRVGDATIAVARGFDPELLRAVVAALAGGAS